MIILDTSVWVEFLQGNRPYYDQVSNLLARNEVLALGPIFGELLQGARNDPDRGLILEFWDSLPKTVETDLFVRAGAASGRHKWMDSGVGLIDASIVVAARDSSSFVWTLDKKLNRLLKNEERYLSPA